VDGPLIRLLPVQRAIHPAGRPGRGRGGGPRAPEAPPCLPGPPPLLCGGSFVSERSPGPQRGVAV